jgi:hypothetical protein
MLFLEATPRVRSPDRVALFAHGLAPGAVRREGAAGVELVAPGEGV